ncbi:hypothetical protein GCM10010399_84670 [Dactylosporangium fulvum]|uniref:hypothetical protein n=1 Tax=Dactylosporangium fulvum TaxID=53359 RepID=UPI0031E1708D
MERKPVVVLAENDYRYGTGPVRLRVERVEHAEEVVLDGEPWLPVHGTRLRGDGTERGAVRLLVRAARLSPAVPGGQPGPGGGAPRPPGRMAR